MVKIQDIFIITGKSIWQGWDKRRLCVCMYFHALTSNFLKQLSFVNRNSVWLNVPQPKKSVNPIFLSSETKLNNVPVLGHNWQSLILQLSKHSGCLDIVSILTHAELGKVCQPWNQKIWVPNLLGPSLAGWPLPSLYIAQILHLLISKVGCNICGGLFVNCEALPMSHSLTVVAPIPNIVPRKKDAIFVEWQRKRGASCPKKKNISQAKYCSNGFSYRTIQRHIKGIQLCTNGDTLEPLCETLLIITQQLDQE